MVCTGEEEQVVECRHSRSENCGAGEAFGVICDGRRVSDNNNNNYNNNNNRRVSEGKDALLCELYSGSEHGRKSFGNETSLDSCPASDVENCDGSEGAGVFCDVGGEPGG